MPIRYALNTKIEDQKQVAAILVNYFSTIASNIGGNHVTSLSESEFNNDSSIQMTETVYNNSIFQIKRVNTEDVQVSFENLNPIKSCSDTGLMAKLIIKVAEGIAPSVTTFYNKIETSHPFPYSLVLFFLLVLYVKICTYCNRCNLRPYCNTYLTLNIQNL